MPFDYTICLPLVLTASRFGGMMVYSPLLAESAVPRRLRILLALVMALAVAGRVAPAALPASSVALVLAMAGEFLIGLAIGYAARLIFVGVELGAFHAGQQMGLSLAEVFNPLGDDAPDALRKMLHLLTLVLFLAIGGHRLMISALVGSFQTLPLVSFTQPGAVLSTLTALLTVSFTLALKIAAPVLIAIVLASVAMAFIQRTLPQANILSTGLPVRLLLGFVVILAVLAMGALPELVEQASRGVAGYLKTMLQVRA